MQITITLDMVLAARSKYEAIEHRPLSKAYTLMVLEAGLKAGGYAIKDETGL